MKTKLFVLLLAVLLLTRLPIAACGVQTEGTQSVSPAGETQSTTEATVTPATQPATEPVTQPTEATASIPTALQIDTRHIYDGMDLAYEDGYMPRVENGYVYIVLPLLSNGDIYHNEIKASLNLSSASSVFVIANYEKTFPLEEVCPQNSTKAQELFLVEFEVQLAEGRVNGTYPVVVNISGYSNSGAAVDCIYTLYVTITDGKSSTASPTYTETATAEPVVYIARTQASSDRIMAGDEFSLTLTLKNSLDTKSVKNLMVKVDTGSLQIALAEDTNVFQIDQISAGGETELTLRFRTDASLAEGKYTLTFSFSYDSSKTLNLSSSGTTIVQIGQEANMELTAPRFADTVTVGETVSLELQVMNMGRSAMHNVRCVVSGYGFAPSNTGYIGTMEAGTSATTQVELYILALNASPGNENGSPYGDTTGTITLLYENDAGEEFQQERSFETTVNRPVVQLAQTADTQQEEEKMASAWWISILILGGVILAAVLTALLIRRKNRKGGHYL